MKENAYSCTLRAPSHLFYVSTVICTLRIVAAQLNGCDDIRVIYFLFFFFLIFDALSSLANHRQGVEGRPSA